MAERAISPLLVRSAGLDIAVRNVEVKQSSSGFDLASQPPCPINCETPGESTNPTAGNP